MNSLIFLGTFAVISLMTAQALEGVPIDMTTLTSNKSGLMSNNTDDLILMEKVGIATTLAFLVGSVQVRQLIIENQRDETSTLCSS